MGINAARLKLKLFGIKFTNKLRSLGLDRESPLNRRRDLALLMMYIIHRAKWRRRLGTGIRFN